MIRSQTAFRLPHLPPAVDKIEDLCRLVRSYLEQSPLHVAVLLALPRTLPFLLVCVQHACNLLPPSRQSLIARTYLDYCDVLTTQGPGPAFRDCLSSRSLHSFLRHWHRTRTAPEPAPALAAAAPAVGTAGSGVRGAAEVERAASVSSRDSLAQVEYNPFSSVGMTLHGVTLFGLPQINTTGGVCRLSVMVVADQGILFSSPVSAFGQDQGGAHFPMRVRMVGDAFVKLYHRSTSDQSNTLLLTFAFHPRFSSYPDRRCLRISHADFDLDDRKLFPPSFSMELEFDPPAPAPALASRSPPRSLRSSSMSRGGASAGAGAGAGAGAAGAGDGGVRGSGELQRVDRLAGLHARAEAGPSGAAAAASDSDTALMMLMQALLGISLARNNPAPTELVRMLPVVRVCVGSTMATEECAICREQFQPDEPVRLLPCMHFYHSPCIDPWFELQDHCPVCKSRLCAENLQFMG
eukprot:m.127092 g.127092  ORF g.127092 m.127092 type:complete len:465 (-) comp14699_c8_seq1:20-1414(-)